MNFVKDKSLYYRVLNTSIKNKNIKQQQKKPHDFLDKSFLRLQIPSS